MNINFVIFVLLLCFSFTYLEASEQSWLFDSARVWGRGRTYVAAYESDESSRFNAAALGESDVSFQLRPLQLDFFVGKNTTSTFNDLLSAAGSNDAFSVLRKFDDKFGQLQYFKAQGSFFSLRFGSFEISPFGLNDAFLKLELPPSPEMSWKVDSVVGLNLSYGFELKQDMFIGLTLRPLYRWYIEGKVAFADIVELLGPTSTRFEDFTPLVSAAAVGGDLGFIWNLSPGFRWGVTVRNIGDTSATSDFEETPPAIRQNISTGLLSRSSLGGIADLDLYLDIHSLTNRDGLNLLRLINTGFELGSSVFSRDHDFGVLGGISEGYASLGAFFDLYFLRVDITSYGIETGIESGQLQDRRWAISGRSSLTL